MSQSTSSSDGEPSGTWPAPIEEIRQLIRDRKITKELIDTIEFQQVWEKVPTCLKSDCPEEVWASLSTLGRLSAVSKPAERLAQPVIAKRLASSLPEMLRLSDGDDRYYLAKSMEYGNNPDIHNIAFRELAEEDAAETARRIWANIAGQSTNSLSDFLIRLNGEFALVRRDQKFSGDAICRRLRRINAVIEEFLATSDCEAGDDLGQNLRNFFCGHVPRSGPEDRKLRNEAAIEFLGSIKNIVRLNFSARTDPETYKIIAGFSNWWGHASPPKEFQNRAIPIVRLGFETLMSFAKQGVMNKPLRQALVDASDEQVVEAIARDFTTRTHAIESNVAYWLIHGAEPKETRSVHAVAALSETKLDDYVARLLIALELLEGRKSDLEQAVRDVADIMPVEADIISTAMTRVTQIGQWARAVARARQIELNPQRGELVLFDPVSHVGPDDIKVGEKVRVSTAGALKNTQGNIKVITIKAEVERYRG